MQLINLQVIVLDFYLADNLDPMKEEFKEYSKIIYDYNMASNRTNREGFGSVSFS